MKQQKLERRAQSTLVNVDCVSVRDLTDIITLKRVVNKAIRLVGDFTGTEATYMKYVIGVARHCTVECRFDAATRIAVEHEISAQLAVRRDRQDRRVLRKAPNAYRVHERVYALWRTATAYRRASGKWAGGTRFFVRYDSKAGATSLTVEKLTEWSRNRKWSGARVDYTLTVGRAWIGSVLLRGIAVVGGRFVLRAASSEHPKVYKITYASQQQNRYAIREEEGYVCVGHDAIFVRYEDAARAYEAHALA